MTSRLKRKLNDLGVDPASAKANESFCLIGTPLPPLEKSKDTGEYVPLWKQEVRDEKGRRRLHGAFTGGFSAGYFNTVGSKEGWTPSTFVSSRSERAKQKAVRPEDFMDEEDLAELAESRKLVDEHDEMDFGGTEAELRRRAGAEEPENDTIATALAASLAPAPKDSVGARILKKMGWRIGQGIGPRVTYAQRKAQDAGFMDYSREAEDDADEEAKKHSYPRRDTPVIVSQRKDNSHGLGYQPGMSLNESLGSRHGASGSKGPNISAGFGLGALNDADEDDLDVYEGGLSKHARTRMAYDAEDADDDSHVAMGSSKARHTGQGRDTRTTSVTTQTFSDGRPVLKGFVLSDKPVAEDRWFPLPEIPKGWTPNPQRVWNKGKEKENIDHNEDASHAKQPPKTHAQWKDSFMSADERGSLLGETPLPSKPRSIFDYMSQKDRERLQNIRNAPPQTSTTASPTPETPPPPLQFTPAEVIIPHLHPSVAKAALHGFKPFASDPVKESRYTAFLQYQANHEAGSSNAHLTIGRTPGQSIEEFNKELDDYAKSATVFKPLSGAMADRFKTAVIVENGPKIIEGLHTPSLSDEPKGDEEKAEKEKEKEDPKMGAVRLGMYGALTREVQPWQPAKLLCKRFGVKDPEVDVGAGAAAESARTAAASSIGTDGQAGGPVEDTADGAAAASTIAMIADGSTGKARSAGPRNLANVGLGDDEDQGRDTLTYQRPSMDIFKAIFASDDEESDDEGGDGGDDEKGTGDLGTGPDVGVKVEPIPAHLAGETVPPASYDPPTSGSTSVANGQDKVDIASFKPTFIPRSEREARKDKGKEKDKSKKEKKSTSKATLSFDVEEDGLALNLSVPPKKEKKHKEKDRDGERKRKKRKETQVGDEDDSMWVEKPPAEAVKNLPAEHLVPSPSDAPSTADPSSETPARETIQPPRGRKRAIDFM